MTDKEKKEQVGKGGQSGRELTDSEMDQIAGGDPRGAPVDSNLDRLSRLPNQGGGMH